MTTIWSRAAQWAGYDGAQASVLDVGRGIAILSVIYGHALAPWFMGAGDNFSEAAFLQWKFGAAFMMVFFFFLSGVGWRESKSLATTMRQALALVLITWIASVLFDVFRLVVTVAGYAQAVGIVPLDPVRFVRGLARMAVFGDQYSLTALWFLAASAVVRVLAALAIRMGNAALVAVAVALLALTLTATDLSWRNFYQVTLIGVAFAAFIAGHFSRDIVSALERSPAAAYALLLIGGAGAVSTFHLNEGCRWDIAAQCGQAWLGDRFGVSMIIGQFGNLPMFVVTALFGIGFATALSILVARYGAMAGAKLESWGRNSLNLLIVNSLFLHLMNPQIERWIMPRVEGEGPIFFLVLLSLTLAANLWALHALARPLHKLNSFATARARDIVSLIRRLGVVIAARRPVRVSQGHE